MNALINWIMSILGIVIIGTIATLLLPEGRINKFIKSIMATITVLVIFLPLPSLLKNDFNIEDGNLIKADFNLDQNYLDLVESIKMQYFAKGIEEKLSSDGVSGAVVTVDGTFKDGEIKINFISANLSNIVIAENKQHINKYELVRGLIKNYLGINEGQIIINE